ncbi:MAG: type II toxin-antitoxin system Phd/YefM family antitoxin [Actinomycetes bacterium]|jgi:prevent-host-death family protein
MTSLSISQARADLADVISRAQKKPITISKHGKPIAILINPSLYQAMLESVEELEDIEAFDQSMADTSPSIPWERVKKDLGLL